MTDSTNKRGEPDRSLINVNQDHDLRYWTQTLDVTEDELRRRAGRGHVSDKVREYLRSQ